MADQPRTSGEHMHPALKGGNKLESPYTKSQMAKINDSLTEAKSNTKGTFGDHPHEKGTTR